MTQSHDNIAQMQNNVIGLSQRVFFFFKSCQLSLCTQRVGQEERDRLTSFSILYHGPTMSPHVCFYISQITNVLVLTRLTITPRVDDCLLPMPGKPPVRRRLPSDPPGRRLSSRRSFMLLLLLLLQLLDWTAGGEERDETTSLSHGAPPNGAHSISRHLTTVVRFSFSHPLLVFRFSFEFSSFLSTDFVYFDCSSITLRIRILDSKFIL